MKKILVAVVAAVVAFVIFTVVNDRQDTGTAPEAAKFDAGRAVSVVSRESGSGTRGAFVELFGIEVKAEDGTRKDMTTREAVIADKTDIVMTNIANDLYAIGYISLGSLNETVKALKIDGIEASAENMRNGTYTVQRPFNIATKGEPSAPAKDFIDFILSREGQDVVAANRLVGVNENADPWRGGGRAGKIVVAGSSSITPLMEKLKEAYVAVTPDVDIEIQMSDSTAGMTAAMNGTCDIGMSSRELKDSEKAVLTGTSVALDGIAVIVNVENPLKELSKEQVRSVFTGELTKWSDVI